MQSAHGCRAADVLELQNNNCSTVEARRLAPLGHGDGVSQEVGEIYDHALGERHCYPLERHMCRSQKVWWRKMKEGQFTTEDFWPRSKVYRSQPSMNSPLGRSQNGLRVKFLETR